MQDRVLYSKKIDWKQIKTLQPDNFKVPEQQEVLKKSLLANGFVSPFCVWQDPEGVIWSIDGVHRIKALTELQEQGQNIPELLTANFIEAKDRKEAGIMLLEVFNTKQNKATEQGLELLKIDLNISNDDLHVDLSDLNISINFDDEVDLSVLDDDDNAQAETMQSEVRKGLVVDFLPDDYDRAIELFKFFRDSGEYLGGLILSCLQNEKNKSQ